MGPHVWVVTGVVALLSVLLILDLRRRPERRPVRLAAGLVALGALLGLGLQPNTTATVTTGRSLLVTEGADRETVERLVEEEGPWREVYRVDGADGAVGGVRGPSLVGGIGFLANRGVRDTLHVVGDGLRSWEWERYAGAVVSSRPAVPSSDRNAAGLIDLAWGREVRLGGSVPIVGMVGVGSGDGPSTVELSEAGVVVAAAQADAGGRFEVRYAPRETGRRVLEVSLDVAPDEVPVVRDTIGVFVTDPVTPAVLVLEGSANFETRYLKAWLGGRGGRVAVRSTISSERFRSEYINGPEVSLDRVTRRLLAGFDLVVVDARTWRSLGATQRNTILAAAAEDRLGMLLLPDASFLDSLAAGRVGGRLSALAGRRIGDLDSRTVRLRWAGSQLDSLTVLPVLPFEITPSPGVQPLVRDELGSVLVAALPGGGGTIALSLVVESYRWLLQGRRSEYDAYWSHLVDAATGGASGPVWRVGARGPVFAGTPVDLVISDAVDPGSARIESPGATLMPLALSRDPYESDRWSGTFWPIRAGWHMATTPDTPEFWFYVNDPAEMADLQREFARADTRLRSQMNPDEGAAEPVESTVPIPLAWFFVAFCLGAGVLWGETRI